MDKMILVINPGSTSTKVAIFKGAENFKSRVLTYSSDDLKGYNSVIEQFEMRLYDILKWLEQEGIDIKDFEAVVGRGGMVRPIPGGTYIVTDALVEDLKNQVGGEHASNLGGLLAKNIADRAGIPAFIVDPVAVDEFEDIARISGMPEISRMSHAHALNIKAVARKVAHKMGKPLAELNLIIVHLGGGISVSALRGGRQIDVNDANEGGPFSPERTGSLAALDLVRLCYSGKYTYSQMKKKIVGHGGITAYLGTNDIREVENRIETGDRYAELIFNAMAYQVSKEIGSMSAVLYGKVDAIILTGGGAYSKRITTLIGDRVRFIAPVIIEAGEDELRSLAEGVFRLINGEEKPKIYEDEVIKIEKF
ncbi:butyrate kinase [Calorimonas adulescens]|uniref:Probable butyrate kinase n=1 Tax=Calorimonas adulescens TaxID=2606906 RepID=A0A5D8QA94_9THEO|nr:butyrate kinase [Calorimonas adulescens]TZE81317.1 butyrate kinase [Calorimonas adulescens]